MHTIILLTISNIFMTFAWYGHLKYKDSPLWMAIVASWGIAFFEYCLFSVLYLKEPLKWNYVAGFSMMVGAVFIIFYKW